jgi:excinuclease ABC subunit C
MAAGEAFDHKRFLAHVSEGPGVYRMQDVQGTVIYVGKAKSLRKRLGSYFTRAQNGKTQALVGHIHHIEVTLTRTEREALLLEDTLIKQHQPRYNVLLRDDKSFPYIRLEGGHDFPRLRYYRGARAASARLFGPYPDSLAVRRALHLLHKVFRLRNCEDSFFEHRSRPCLQYQIKRCSAPCVGLISRADYQRDLNHAVQLLEGRGEALLADLAARMESASQALAFEEAARLRDQIADLRLMQEKRRTHTGLGDVDVLGVAREGVQACVLILYLRGGVQLGHHAWHFSLNAGERDAELLSGFVARYYLGQTPPDEVLLPFPVEGREALEQELSERRGRRLRLVSRVIGVRAGLLQDAARNAAEALKLRLASRASTGQRLEALASALGLGEVPARMECFDISHTQGDKTVASCVVFAEGQPLKSAYRRFHIEDITGGDDYAALRQALERRFKRLVAGEAPLPSVLFIDGGRGQLTQAGQVLAALNVTGVMAVGVAKGSDRRAGQEILFTAAHPGGLALPPDSPALHLVQQIRDEAHRFAITGHRARRAKGVQQSTLEEIAGLGPRKRQALLKHMGGLREVSRAAVEDLMRVPGVHRALAERIHAHFHPG